MAPAPKLHPVDAVEIERARSEIRWNNADCELKELELQVIKSSSTAQGTFCLFDGVDDDTVHPLMMGMAHWSRNHPGAPITLLINSPGGSVISGFAFFDFLEELRRSGHRLTTKGFGMQASMGGIVLQAGDERVMSARSWLLIHEVQGLVAGSFSQMDDDMKFNERLQKQAVAILTARSNLSERAIKNRWKRKDWWLDATEALKSGFIDRIES